MSAIRIADLIDKDVSGIRGDVRGRRYEWADPLVRNLIRCERKTEKRKGIKESWIYLYWKPEARTDGGMDCGYSGWEEEHFKELDPVIILEGEYGIRAVSDDDEYYR